MSAYLIISINTEILSDFLQKLSQGVNHITYIQRKLWIISSNQCRNIFVHICTLEWAQWKLSCFEFKFDDTRLYS